MCDIQVLEDLVLDHLNIENVEDKLWKIENSPLEGRGIFAAKDIQVGEVIFIDTAIVSGPRAGVNPKIHCIICMKTQNIKACSKGCGLPVCSLECEQNLNHLKECEYIGNHGGPFNEISIELLRALATIRGLLLEDKAKDLLFCLTKHVHEKHGFEVELIKSKLNIPETDEENLKKICYIFDANIFETVVDPKDDLIEFSIRGLYPVSALLNHCCVPNTTHLFDGNQRMIIKSTVFIPKGTEILTSYTSLLWATAARRHHLWTTKHFYCQCQRCKDPTEFNSGLSGLKCINPNICEGVLFPLNGMDPYSKWACNLCDQKVNRKGIGVIQSALGSMLCSTDVPDVNQLITLLRDRIKYVVPVSNQICVELKMKVAWLIGRSSSLWNGAPEYIKRKLEIRRHEEVSTENLYFKEKILRDLLDVVNKLGAGQCKTKGLILCELYSTLTEIHKRKIYIDNGVKGEEEIERQKLLREASEILYQDFRAPIEVKLYIDNCHSIL